MNDTVAQFLKTIRLLWNRRWVVLGVATVVCAIGWPLVYMMPNKYETMARVYLNTETLLTPLLRGLAVDNNSKEKLASTARRTLLSRPNLEKVIRETDMDLEAHTAEDMERLLQALSEKIDVKGRPRDGIYTISYEDTDPQRAKKVVETLLSIFMETTLKGSRSDTTVTERFIEEQIKEYEARLTAAEERLKEFKRKNIGLMPSDAGGYFNRLQAESERLEEARLQLREAINRRDELRLQIQGEAQQNRQRQLMEEMAALYDSRIASMEARLDDLLLQFTEQHPDVVTLKESIEELKRQKAEELERRMQELSTQADASTVSDELRAALSTAEANVAALQVRVDEYERRVQHLKSMIDTIPKVEAEFARLNRDYDINRRNYEELVARRESAKISRDADQSVDDIQFRIIDPPVVPVVPSGPNRPLLFTVVLVLGFALGIAVAWGLSMIRPAFYEQKDLREFTGLPVFGTVALVMDKKRRMKRKLNAISFGIAGLLLLSAYGVLIVLQIVG